MDRAADVAIVGFFLSHLSAEEESKFMEIMDTLLTKKKEMLIIDSVWSDERMATRKKEGMQKRRLNDGAEFEIFKKYFTSEDVEKIGKSIGSKTKIEYFGRTMFIASFREK